MVNTRKFMRSLGCAWNGVVIVFREEQNFRIEIIAGVAALILALAMKFSPLEFCILILTIFAVLGAELANSLGERFIDVIHPRVSPVVGAIKDILAALVFVAAFASVLIGIVLFLPKIIERFIFAAL